MEKSLYLKKGGNDEKIITDYKKKKERGKILKEKEKEMRRR